MTDRAHNRVIAALRKSWNRVTGFFALLVERSRKRVLNGRHKELVESEQQYRRLIESAPIAVAVHCDGKLVYVNAAVVRLMGGTEPHEFLGRFVVDLIHPDYLDEVKIRISQTQNDLLPVGPVEEKFVRLDGQIIDVEISALPFVYEGRPATQILVRDITQQKQAVEALRRSQEAEHAQRALSDALRNVTALLNQTLDFDEVIDRILTYVGHVVPHDVSTIMLIKDGIAHAVRCRGYAAYGLTEYALSIAMPVNDFVNLREMVATRQPYVVPDLDADPSWIWLKDSELMKSYAGAPICHGGQVVGFVHLLSSTPGFFTRSHAERLQAFADQAAVAIRNAQLFAAEQEERALSDALRDSLAILNSSLDLNDVFDKLLTIIKPVVAHDAANIMMFDDEMAHVVASRGYEKRGAEDWMRTLQIPLNGQPVLRYILGRGQICIVNNTQTDSGWISYPQTAWIRSYLSAPIRAEGRVIGLINLDSARINLFTQADGERLQAFADQAAVAIQNARLYDQLSRHAAELSALYRSSAFLFTPLSGSSDLAEIGQKIAEAVVHEFKKVDCGVMLVDETSGQLVRLGRAGEYQVQAKTTLYLDGPGLVPAAVRAGEVVYVPDVVGDRRYFASDPRTRSEMVMPLRTSKGVIGVFDLQSTERYAFSEQDQKTLAAFAERVAVTIENMQLYAEIRRYTDELERRVSERTVDLSVRNAVAETLSSSLDMNEMLTGVLHTTVRELEVMGGAVYLLNPDSTLSLVAHTGVSPETLNVVTGIMPNQTDLSLSRHTPDGSLDDVQIISQKTGVSAVLNVPIWRQEQMQGIVTLVHNEPRPWRNEEMRMLDAIGRQIGVALANAGLYAEAVRDEAHIRTILKSVADGLLVFDQDANLVLMNPAAEALFAFYPEDSGGAIQAAKWLWLWLQYRNSLPNASDAVEFPLPAEPLRDKIEEQCTREDCLGAEREDTAWPCWLQIGGADEPPNHCAIYQRLPRRAIQAHSAEVRDAEGTALGTVIVLHDVTYYRELDELKGRFVSTVSHELRTPLSTVLLQVSTLLKYYDRFDEVERREMIGEIQQQAHVLRELIEDILELSRFDAKRAVPQKQWFDLAEQCRNIITQMQAMINDKGLTVNLDQCTGKHYILGDPHQLGRMFGNLLGNAVKYTPAGGKITVALKEDDDAIRIVVADTGIGISPEDQHYVFDRFFRAEGASSIASGTGLGLAISREIIELHGGRIELQSVVGVGSEFTVYLPLAAPVTTP